jgi:hypothetical protein
MLTINQIGLGRQIDDLRHQLERMAGADTNKVIARTLASIALTLRNRIISSMQTGRRTVGPSGMEYQRPGGKVHRASAPGEPPAVDTGELISRVTMEYSAAAVRAEVGIAGGAPYAPFLEFGHFTGGSGTRSGGAFWTEPRPFLGPVAEEMGPWIREKLLDAVREIATFHTRSGATLYD